MLKFEPTQHLIDMCERGNHHVGDALSAVVGILPTFLDPMNPNLAIEQFNQNYVSGWSDIKEFQMQVNAKLKYPGDPPLIPFAKAVLHGEFIYVYRSGIVAVIDVDGNFRVSRLD